MLDSKIRELIEDTLHIRKRYSSPPDEYTQVLQNLETLATITSEIEIKSIDHINIREEPMSINNNQYMMY